MRTWQFNFCCLLSCLVLFIITNVAYATTWDEPWHEQVVKEADYFVLARVAESNEKKATLTILQTLGGPSLSGTIGLTDFYLLDLCSMSGGHGPEFHLGKMDSAYFFLKKNSTGNYSIATPTTGFAPVSGRQVAATYRHSYHRGVVDRPIYELTMTAIFQHSHGQPYAADAVRSYIGEQLALSPAQLNEEGMAEFFRQHAALETIYHLGLTDYYTAILPFLHNTENFHAQVSAARALTANNNSEADAQLLALLSDKKTRDFAKVIAIRTLATHQPKAMKSELQKLIRKASEEEDGFGGDIMDPRVCTHIPTVKTALTELVTSL